ncbi:MAG: tetratricopeptide repeat protein [Deltaproteobacteria bacterium]|nr:tetratricopeptide repeat protein [Deltaproteobacteria bacterium]
MAGDNGIIVSSDVIRRHLRYGDWDLARLAAEGALETAAEEDKGVLYALLSRAWYRLGKPRRALAMAEEGAKRSDHWEVSLALGEALVAIGDPLPGRALLTEALKVARERGAPPPSEDTYQASADDLAPWQAAEIELRTAVAEAYRAAGEPEAGIGIAARAEALAQLRFGANSLQAAEALHALGLCQHGAGQQDEARASLKRSLAILEANNPEHTAVAAVLDALGVVARARKKPFEAVKLHRKALELWTRRLGQHASPVGACRHSLAQALHRTGDFLAARVEMREALVITARTLGKDHVDTWITRFEVGRFEVDCGEMEEGFKVMEEARTAVRGRLGPQHPVVKAMDSYL